MASIVLPNTALLDCYIRAKISIRDYYSQHSKLLVMYIVIDGVPYSRGPREFLGNQGSAHSLSRSKRFCRAAAASSLGGGVRPGEGSIDLLRIIQDSWASRIRKVCISRKHRLFERLRGFRGLFVKRGWVQV